MQYHICQNVLTDGVKTKIFEGFGQHALHATGMNGLSEEPISFEIFDGNEFVGAVVVQLFWGQLHIKYLFVMEKYRGKGIARQLMLHAFDFGINRGCHFAFVETMSFQALEFYQKLGFITELSRTGYASETTFHYLKKALVDSLPARKMTRIGVYGVAQEEGKTLLIVQQRGPYRGKFDFPGGGIEFGESPEEGLRREFSEEVACGFTHSKLLTNLTAIIEVPRIGEKEPYTFYQMGMIYQVQGLHPLIEVDKEDLESRWEVLSHLTQNQCSPLLWKFIESL